MLHPNQPHIAFFRAQDIQGIEELVKGVQLIWAGHANDILDQVLLKKAE